MTRRWLWPLLAILAGLALSLTRWLGIPICLALAGLFLVRRDWRKAIWFGLPGLLGLGVALWSSSQVPDIYTHLTWAKVLGNIVPMLITQTTLTGGMLGVGLMLVLVVLMRERHGTVILVATLGYLAGLWAGGWGFDYPSMGNRMFVASSVLITLMIVTHRPPGFERGNKIIVLVLAVFTVIAGWQIWHAKNSGAGNYNAPMYRDSKVVQLVRAMPESVAIFSNAPDALWFQTGRKVWSLPRTDSLPSMTPGAPPMEAGGLVIVFKQGRNYFLPPDKYAHLVAKDSAGQSRVADLGIAWIVELRKDAK